MKAVENGGTCVGIRCNDGVVLAVEKIIVSKLLKPGANKRIATVDRNVGIVTSGLLPDGRHLTSRARDEASSWRRTYKGPIPVSALAARLGGYVQAYTLYSSVRPFGVTAIMGGWDSELESPVDGQVGTGPTSGAGGKVTDDDKNGKISRGGPGLYMIEPSGLYWVGLSPLPQRPYSTSLGLLWRSYRQGKTGCEGRIGKARPRLPSQQPQSGRSRQGSRTNHLRSARRFERQRLRARDDLDLE